jgi:hypothetical protein
MANCYGSLQVCAIRVARLETSGAPDNGAGNGYVSDALISLQVGVELTTGDDLEQKNGCGAICQSFKDCDRIKRLTFTMNLCQLDAELIELLTGATLLQDLPGTGEAIGWMFPAVDAACPDGVSLEVWTKAWDGSEQATPTYLSNAAGYWHWVFPRTKWVMGQVTMENGIMVVPVTGFGEENSSITADGPFNDWPVEVANQGGITRVGGVFLDDELPTASCGYISVTSTAS